MLVLFFILIYEPWKKKSHSISKRVDKACFPAYLSPCVPFSACHLSLCPLCFATRLGRRNHVIDSAYTQMPKKSGALTLQPEERLWLEDARNGDPQAFAMLVDMYSRPVYNLCYRMLGNPQDAEDAAQEAFLRAYRSLNRYDPNRKLITWLLSIAAHYCIDQQRRMRPPLVSLDETGPGELRERGAGPDKAYLVQETGDEVQQLLAQIPGRDRAAIILYYWYDMSYQEIAVQLKLTESALKARLHRARRSLAKVWLETDGAPLLAQRRPNESVSL